MPIFKKSLYLQLSMEMVSLTHNVPHLIANLANASAALNGALPNLNWVGFYLVEGDKLLLGPFQGRPACIEIPKGKGVCGTAWAENRTLVVPDVHRFPGHIACDAASNSEIVVPLRKDGLVVAVLDIDSPAIGRFDEDDRLGLESVAKVLENCF